MSETVITFGATLARQMAPEQMARRFYEAVAQATDRGGSSGCAIVGAVTSHIPNVVNVECVLDDLTPDQALIALDIAARRIARINGLGVPGPTPAIDADDAPPLRQLAENLVDRIRASAFDPRRDPLTRTFDLAREAAVREVLVALVTAPISPAMLRSA